MVVVQFFCHSFSLAEVDDLGPQYLPTFKAASCVPYIVKCAVNDSERSERRGIRNRSSCLLVTFSPILLLLYFTESLSLVNYKMIPKVLFQPTKAFSALNVLHNLKEFATEAYFCLSHLVLALYITRRFLRYNFSQLMSFRH